MKRIIIIIFLCLLLFCYSVGNQIYADSSNYMTFTEIMMADGKLLVNYTDEEMTEELKKVSNRKFIGLNVNIVNKNVDASYIANTIYCATNASNTDITYDLTYDVETNNKVTVSANGSLNGSISNGKTSGAKKELGAKCGIDVSETSTTSIKRKEVTKINIEANSKMIVYLTGNLSVTNGVASCYSCFIKVFEGGFEFVVLRNQYAKIEKESL